MEKIIIASVQFNDGDKQTYYYECPLDDVSAGDFVLVDANGAAKVVKVVKLEQFDRCAAPYPADKLKKILSKCGEFTAEEKKDPIKAAAVAIHEKQEALKKLIKTQEFFCPFSLKTDENDAGRFVPQIFYDTRDQSTVLPAFSSEDEIGKLKDSAAFIPTSLDSMIEFARDSVPYVTKIVVNPWSDRLVIPVITKIILSCSVKESRNKLKVVQSIAIHRGGIDSCTTVHDDDERDQDWSLGVNTKKDYLDWFHAVVGLACLARKEKQHVNPDRSEIVIYYFYGSDSIEYITFAADSLPESVREICRRLRAAVPDDLYLAFGKE